jgi:hypothetical protein
VIKVPTPPIWITRDSFVGQLEDHVDVWESRPVRRVYAADDYGAVGVEWLDVAGELGLHLETLTIGEARLKFGTIPDDDRQCVRIG